MDSLSCFLFTYVFSLKPIWLIWVCLQPFLFLWLLMLLAFFFQISAAGTVLLLLIALVVYAMKVVINVIILQQVLTAVLQWRNRLNCAEAWPFPIKCVPYGVREINLPGPCGPSCWAEMSPVYTEKKLSTCQIFTDPESKEFSLWFERGVTSVFTGWYVCCECLEAGALAVWVDVWHFGHMYIMLCNVRDLTDCVCVCVFFLLKPGRSPS